MDFVEQVKSSVDIVKVVGDHVRLKKSAAVAATSACAHFIRRKRPRFECTARINTISASVATQKATSSNLSRRSSGVSFFEALKILAERNGIPMPKRAEYSDPESKLRAALFEMHEMAAATRFAATCSASAGAEARAYLAKRAYNAQAESSAWVVADSLGSAHRRLQHGTDSPRSNWRPAAWCASAEGGGFYDRFRGRSDVPDPQRGGQGDRLSGAVRSRPGTSRSI